jgi:preprotein translocase subunit SecE
MASKVALMSGDDDSSPKKRKSPGALTKVTDTWENFGRFLSDVRAETRKVVTPSRKEVQATTTVVLVAVFIFGVYFYVVDKIFDLGLHALLNRLGGVR